MADSNIGEVLRFLRQAFGMPGACEQTDRELLEKFLVHKEESAFTHLVQRHGPMIFGVCRRLLLDMHEAEDAFQATFLVLVRRAASIRRQESAGSWLYGIAQRISVRAKTQNRARRIREREAAIMSARQSSHDPSLEELRTVLDEEIAALAEKYRGPIILCHLENKSYDQAARELGCPKTTLARRLTKARELLRAKLERRGITLTVAALATALTETAQAAPLPAFLAMNTVKAATLMAAGKTVAGGCISAGALALAEEALTGMLLVKGKMVVMVLALGLAVGGVGWAGYRGVAETGRPSQAIGNQKVSARIPEPEALARSTESLASASGSEDKLRVDANGDPLPKGAVARLGALRFRHDGEAKALVFSPDGKTLVGYTNSGIKVWDATTGLERYQLRLPKRDSVSGESLGMAISTDGSMLALPEALDGDSFESKVTLYDIKTGWKLRSLSSPNEIGPLGQISHLCFSLDGKSLAASCTSDGRAIIFDLESGKVRVALSGPAKVGVLGPLFYNIAFSPDSKTLAAAVHDRANSHNMQLWDTSSGKLLRILHDLPPMHPDGYVRALTFSPDGKSLALGFRDKILLTDPATGKQLALLEIEGMGQPTGLAFTPDGKKLVSNGLFDGKISVWDMETRKVLHTFDKRMSLGRVMALSGDGKTVALGTIGKVIRLWEVDTGKELFTENRGHDFLISDLAFSPDGKTLVSAGDYGLTIVWDSALWKRSGIIPVDARSLSFSPNGKQIVTVANNSNRARIWDVDTAKKTSDFTIPYPKNQKPLMPEAKEIKSAIFSPDGKKVFTLDWNRNRQHWYDLRRWDLASGKQEEMWTIPDNHTYTVSLARDGKTVFALSSKILSIYNTVSGRERLLSLEDEFARNLASSPDGRVLAVGIGYYRAVAKDNKDFPVFRLLEVLTGKEISHLNGYSADGPIAWTSDLRFAAFHDNIKDPQSEKWAHTIRIMDMANNKEVARFGGEGSSVTSFNFSPDGKFLVTGHQDSSMLVWDLSKLKPQRDSEPKLNQQDLENLWKNLGADKTGTAHEALWAFVDAPKQSLPFLRTKLHPVPLADQAKIQKWFADLDSDNFAIRQAATKELEKIGDQVQAPIKKALEGTPSLETRRRLEQISNSLADVPGPETVRIIRAIMALERIGTPEARAVLEILARGAPGARETEEAKGSLERMAPG